MKENLLQKTRKFMQDEKIDLLIVFSTDEFLNEYSDLRENARYLLTNFSGSAGDVLLTQKEMYLFVDGRYHIQAEQETNSSLITVVKVGMDKSIQTALAEKTAEISLENQTLGLVSRKISFQGYKKLCEVLKEKNLKIKELETDPVTEGILLEQNSELRAISLDVCGKTAENKLNCVIEENLKHSLDAFVITKLEEIAYLTNLRGNEIPYSSCFKSKAVIIGDICCIYTDLDKITPEISLYLGDKFVFKDFADDFCKLFDDFPQTINIGYDDSSINLFDMRKLEKSRHNAVNIENNPIMQMKSIKTPKELVHIQDCFRKTDEVVMSAINWLNKNLAENKDISEKDFSDKVKSLYLEHGATGLSFETIAASGENTAIIHYTKASPDKKIKSGEMVLLDCGAYFKGGYATDITRTFLAGGGIIPAAVKQKEIYTRVLKAFLSGINFKLEKHTTGQDIDKKVRENIEQNKPEGFNFSHGTGHGVGISVHESPPRIGPSEASKVALKEGMCFTIEPGLYFQGWGGVRIENTVAIFHNKNQITTLSHANLDKNLINEEMLTEEEKSWLEKYEKEAID